MSQKARRLQAYAAATARLKASLTRDQLELVREWVAATAELLPTDLPDATPVTTAPPVVMEATA